MATPMFDKLREMNSSTPTVQLMKKTAEQQRKEKAAATGTPYKVNQTTYSTPQSPTPTYTPVYTGKVSDSYVPGTLGNQKVGSGGGGGTSIDPGNTPPPDFDYGDDPPKPADGLGGGEFTSSDYYQKMLDEQQRAIQQRINAAVDRNNAYIPQVNQRSDQSLQNAYILREQNKVNAPQALSAMGIQGGAAESSLLGINTGYENTRNEVEQNRGNSLNEIYQNEQQIRATGDATLSEASANYYQNLIAKQEATEASQKSDFINSIGAYSDDYMAQYNKVTGDNDPTNDYQAAYLLDARNDKISGQAEAKKKDEQTATENYIKMQRLLYDINKPYFKPGSNGAGGLSESEIISMYTNGLISEADARRMLGLE